MAPPETGILSASGASATQFMELGNLGMCWHSQSSREVYSSV